MSRLEGTRIEAVGAVDVQSPGRFETEWLATDDNLAALTALAYRCAASCVAIPRAPARLVCSETVIT